MPAGGQSPARRPPQARPGIERNQTAYGTVDGFTVIRQGLPIILPTVRNGSDRPQEGTVVKFSVISVTGFGDQLTASGITSYRDLFRHLADRINGAQAYVQFVIVTTYEGTAATVVDVLSESDAYDVLTKGIFREKLKNACGLVAPMTV